MSRRELIRMTDEELTAFLEQQRTVVVATVGRDGWPHLMPLWYTVRAGELWAWTYARSQKAKNLQRDDRVTLQVEDGTSYDQLRGVMVKANARLHHDLDVVTAFGLELFRRYGGGAEPAPEVAAMVRAQAPKRVVLQFVAAQPPVSWDHRKLGGTY
jgi:PPOX class probable F420-dependent enzyme